MPAAERVIRQTWVPVGLETGGQFSNATSHDAKPTTLTTVNDLLISGGEWVPRSGDSQFGPTLPSAPLSMVVYNRYPTGPGAATSHLLVSLAGSVVDQSSIATATVRGSLSTRRMVFNAVKNRCFMCNGIDAPFIYDGTSTSTWGVAAPNINLLYTANTAIYNTGTLAVSGGPGGVTTINVTFGGSGYGGAPAVTVAPPPSGVTATATAVVAGGQVVQVVITAQGSGYVSPPAITIAPPGAGDTATAQALITTLGSTQIAGAGTNFLDPAIATGQPIYLFGVRYQIASITDATHLLLTTPYQGITVASIAAPDWQINTGALQWESGNGFRYAYSYYDDVTGHVSNVGPILSVDDAPPANDFSTVVVSNIVTTGDARFTKIILWRTAHGGGILFPLAVLNNTAGPLSYTDNNNDDTTLGTVGPGTLPAPIATNNPPPADLDCAAVWDGRFWGSRPSVPGLLYFSAKNDPNELAIGVGEECWPLTYTVPIPEDSGRMTGSRPVGSNLVIETEKAIFAVLGNAPTNYTLQRLSVKGRGTSQFATATLPGEDANSADILLHFGNDSRLYFLFGPGGDLSYSYPIQDALV
jgi:hypothetical protein